MSEPVEPDVPREHVDALIAHARAMAVAIEVDIERGVARGHPEQPQARANVAGWDFMALALEETYAEED